MGFGVLRYGSLLAFIAHSISAADVSGKLETSFGRNLSPEEAKTSFSFEPDLGLTVRGTRLGLYSLIDRPTDPYEKLAVPKTIFSLNHRFDRSAFFLTPALSVNFVSLDRWSIDGYQVRTTATLMISRTIGGLDLAARAGLFGYANQYQTLASGKRAPEYGLIQRLDAKYQYARLVLEALLIVEQSFNGVWANNYATAQKIGYQFSDEGTVSLQHELLSSVIDGSTGFSRPIRVADGRDSRISIVLGLEL